MSPSTSSSLLCLLVLLCVLPSALCYDVRVYNSTAFNTPTSVVSDGDQYLFTTTNYPIAGSSVVRLPLDGSNTPVYFNWSNLMPGPSDGVALDPTGKTVYVADALANRVLAFNTDGTLQRVVAKGPDRDVVFSVAVDTSGDIYVSTGRGYVVKLSPQGEQLRNWSLNGEAIRGVAVDSAGCVYATGLCYLCVIKFSADSNEVVANFSDPNPVKYGFARGVAVDAAGNIFVSYANSRINKLSANGTLLDVYASAANVPLGPYGLSIDKKGSLWVADGPTGGKNNRLLEFVGVAATSGMSTTSPTPASRLRRHLGRLNRAAQL